MARFPDDGGPAMARSGDDEQKWHSYRHQRDGFLPPLHGPDPMVARPADPVINAIIVGCASSGVVVALLGGLFG